ncbi:PepSY domain-containing protein [Reinekea sp. G2M2-21]|jgi:hypothetical protein|uniref:PepSY domain-containing protein n=1 Tax=Reinekea sp. G2M2-21 TaxID=2788942 RepID=UPI0018A9957A|nr:hypothetical protein [Reinekea sp. G2M2-21]
MIKMIGGLLFSLAVSAIVHADDLSRPDVHPCTGEKIPLTSEKSVVLAIECLYDGRVAKVTQVQSANGQWYYELRVLIPGGRIKNIDVNPETGLPLDPAELEAVTK